MRLMEIAARLLMAGTTWLQLWIAHRHVAARGSVFDYIAEVFLLFDCMRRRCCGTCDRQFDNKVFLGWHKVGDRSQAEANTGDEVGASVDRLAKMNTR